MTAAALRHLFDPPIVVPADLGMRRVHRIRCSKCSAADDVTANTWGGVRNEIDLRNIWQRRGWEIGKNSDKHICPACVMKRKEAKKMSSSPVVALKTETTGYKRLVRSDPPREPTRDEKRLIFQRIHEVYLDEKRGYEIGWSDERVAEDMSVPLAWVSKIREDNFGPLGRSVDVDNLAKECREFLENLRAEEKRAGEWADKIAKEMAANSKTLAELVQKSEKLWERLRGFERHPGAKR